MEMLTRAKLIPNVSDNQFFHFDGMTVTCHCGDYLITADSNELGISTVVNATITHLFSRGSNNIVGKFPVIPFLVDSSPIGNVIVIPTTAGTLYANTSPGISFTLIDDNHYETFTFNGDDIFHPFITGSLTVDNHTIRYEYQHPRTRSSKWGNLRVTITISIGTETHNIVVHYRNCTVSRVQCGDREYRLYNKPRTSEGVYYQQYRSPNKISIPVMNRMLATPSGWHKLIGYPYR